MESLSGTVCERNVKDDECGYWVSVVRGTKCQATMVEQCDSEMWEEKVSQVSRFTVQLCTRGQTVGEKIYILKLTRSYVDKQ